MEELLSNRGCQAVVRIFTGGELRDGERLEAELICFILEV